mgnify:CR=1 FL=1
MGAIDISVLTNKTKVAMLHACVNWLTPGVHDIEDEECDIPYTCPDTLEKQDLLDYLYWWDWDNEDGKMLWSHPNFIDTDEYKDEDGLNVFREGIDVDKLQKVYLEMKSVVEGESKTH